MLATSTTRKMAPAGASVHGRAASALTFAASLQHRAPGRHAVRKSKPDIRQRRFGEDERRQQQRRLHGEKAGARRQQVAADDAPPAGAERRAATTYSRSRSAATIARTPRATNGQPTSAKIPPSGGTRSPSGSTSGSARPQHHSDVDSRQHQDEVGGRDGAARRPSRRVPGHAPMSAPSSERAQRRTSSARPSDARAPCSSRDSRSRPKLSAPSRNTGSRAVRRPRQRTACARDLPTYALRQAIHERERMTNGSSRPPARTTRRRIGGAYRKSRDALGIVGRQPRRDERPTATSPTTSRRDAAHHDARLCEHPRIGGGRSRVGEQGAERRETARRPPPHPATR